MTTTMLVARVHNESESQAVEELAQLVRPKCHPRRRQIARGFEEVGSSASRCTLIRDGERRVSAEEIRRA